jgi:hypothetical protein
MSRTRSRVELPPGRGEGEQRRGEGGVHLNVSIETHGAGVDQRLAMPHTEPVYIPPGLYAVLEDEGRGDFREPTTERGETRAVSTTSMPFQKVSLKRSLRVAGSMATGRAVTERSGFRERRTLSAARVAFFWPTSLSRKRTWRWRFDLSMESGSTTVTLPAPLLSPPAPFSAERGAKIWARSFSSSQPIAPEPTSKRDMSRSSSRTCRGRGVRVGEKSCEGDEGWHDSRERDGDGGEEARGVVWSGVAEAESLKAWPVKAKGGDVTVGRSRSEASNSFKVSEAPTLPTTETATGDTSRGSGAAESRFLNGLPKILSERRSQGHLLPREEGGEGTERILCSTEKVRVREAWKDLAISRGVGGDEAIAPFDSTGDTGDPPLLAILTDFEPWIR